MSEEFDEVAGSIKAPVVIAVDLVATDSIVIMDSEPIKIISMKLKLTGAPGNGGLP